MQTNKKQTTAQAAYKRERDERLTFAATHPAGEVLQELHTALILRFFSIMPSSPFALRSYGRPSGCRYIG